jgi:hypothetical protein
VAAAPARPGQALRVGREAIPVDHAGAAAGQPPTVLHEVAPSADRLGDQRRA